jgi:hypothetical protein
MNLIDNVHFVTPMGRHKGDGFSELPHILYAVVARPIYFNDVYRAALRYFLTVGAGSTRDMFLELSAAQTFC